ncbi:MAG: hypothetical protein AAGJ29_02805 [Pseudomonadota bacterium]
MRLASALFGLMLLTAGLAGYASTEEGAVTNLCEITKGEHLAPPTGGNRSRLMSNGVSIGVFGTGTVAASTKDGFGVVTLQAPGMLHLTFEDGERLTVSIPEDAGRVDVQIKGPNAITCTTSA